MKTKPRRTGLPSTWAEAYDRLALALSDPPGAREWVRQALGGDPSSLERRRRQVAFQKISGVVLALEETGTDYAFVVGCRGEVARVFARYFGGAVLPGPPWSLDPFEDLPSYDEWERSDDFD